MAKKKIMRQGNMRRARHRGPSRPQPAGGTLIAQQTYSNIGTFLRVPYSRDLAACRQRVPGRAL